MNYVIYEWSVKATDLIVVGTAMTFWVNWGNPEVDFGILNTGILPVNAPAEHPN